MAITIDYGSCGKCNEKNSKAANTCRACGAPLPWSKAAQQAQRAAQSPLQNSSFNAPKASLGVSQGFCVQCAGGAVFLCGIGYLVARLMRLVPYIPFLTYGLMAGGAAIWRAGSNMTD
jgi:hypothetical protein